MKATLIRAARALSTVQEFRYGCACLHSQRVACYAYGLARELGLPPKIRRNIYLAGLLHDLGKIGIPDSILLKRDKLTAEEWEKIKLHPVFSYKILSAVPGMREIAVLALHHHERYDGNGYPDGLSGEDIPLGARILALADSYDAMTSERVYRSLVMSLNEAIAEIRACAGKQFDPHLAEVFCRMVSQPEMTGDILTFQLMDG